MLRGPGAIVLPLPAGASECWRARGHGASLGPAGVRASWPGVAPEGGPRPSADGADAGAREGFAAEVASGAERGRGRRPDLPRRA